MKFKNLFFAALMMFAFSFALGQAPLAYDPDDSDLSESCTSIMVGKQASTDGSVMTAHTCDSNYRTWLDIVGRKTYSPGENEAVYWGRLHTEEPWDLRNVVKKGEIPAVEETFAYLNTAYPCMNEKQLAIGETTIVGRPELVNKEGYFLIEELQRVALQRCSTSKDAVLLIGKLAEEYGYGDSGECLTIADKNEIWQIEIFGSGPGKPSAIWVAQRVPDNHVAISANIPRISKVDFNSDEFLYSTDIKERCKKLGYWDGKEEFVFWKINNNKKPFSIREFFVLSQMAPSLNLSFEDEELPFSIKPDKKISVRDVMVFYRETYEGTEWDQTKNLEVEVTRRDRAKGITYKEKVKPISNFMSNDMRDLLNSIKPNVTERVRGIAVIRCSYSQIIQLRDWLPDEVGGVAWFSFDNPAQSPRMPIYAGTISLPQSFSVCGQHRYREDAAIWAFRETNRIATIDWNKTRSILEPQIMSFEDKMFEMAPAIEKRATELIEAGKKEEAKELLTSHTDDFASMTIERWKELKAQLWTIFARSM